MDSKNLAICWWPTLLPYEFTDMVRFEMMRPHLEDTVQAMIDQFPFLFLGKDEVVMVWGWLECATIVTFPSVECEIQLLECFHFQDSSHGHQGVEKHPDAMRLVSVKMISSRWKSVKQRIQSLTSSTFTFVVRSVECGYREPINCHFAVIYLKNRTCQSVKSKKLFKMQQPPSLQSQSVNHGVVTSGCEKLSQSVQIAKHSPFLR